MNIDNGIQKLFFDSIQQRLPGHISLVNEVSEVLGISYDSAYRRLRGSKKLTIEELKTLCNNYRISLDSVFGLNNTDILFQPFVLGMKEGGFEEWLKWRIVEVQRLNSCANKELIMVARELPIFYYFDFPELAAFKLYFWKKMLLHLPEYHDKKFNINEIPSKLLDIGYHLLTAYNLIPSSEIWCQETFIKIMQQIEFCSISGLFMHKNDATSLFDTLESLIRHIQDQTETGCKFHFGVKTSDPEEENFKVFINEILLVDNTVFVKRDQQKLVFMTHNSLDILVTYNASFCNHVEQALRNIMKTSMYISGTSAVECNRYFNSIYEKLDAYKTTSVSNMFVL